MSKHDHNPHGIVLPHQETEELRRELAGYAPTIEDYGFTDRGLQKNPRFQAASRHAEELRSHMDATRKDFLALRDGIWANREVRPDTPFRYGHPPQPTPRMTDNELRRFGMATHLERIVDRAKRNEEEYKGRS